jgi:hypothetical protein
MQKTAIPPINPETLEPLCQQQLQERFPQMAPLQVRCYLREETLVVLVEHHPPVLAYPHQAFKLFEQLLAEAQPSVECTGLMYLRMQGQQQPYAFHIAKVKPKSGAVVEEPRLGKAEEVMPADAELTATSHLSAEIFPETETALNRSFKESWLPIIMAGTGFSLLVFFISLYLLSRPCVLRGCPEISVARSLAQESLDTIEAPPSGQAIFAAQAQLDRSLRILRSIPPWSKHRGEAQRLLASYQKTATELNALVEGLKTAARAGTLTQNPPLPASRWEESQKLWRGAIARLEQLSGDSEFSEFARQKIREYQRNLRAIDRGLKAERDAQENLAAAREIAKTAEVRQDLAQSLENLRLVEAMWQQVTSRLWKIPKIASPYPEAQEALKLYLPQISAVRDRKSQEIFASSTYDRAVRSAEKAKTAEAANQWSEAVTNWRNALSTIKQVPDNTFDSGKAKTLTKTYSNELNRAEAQLQNAVKMQQARNDLTQLCTKTTKVCHFTIDEKGIQVYLTPTYVQQVRTSATNAQSRGDLKTQVELLDHVYTLERALNTISDNVGLPLAVYTNDNVLVQSHRPIGKRQ